MAALQAGARYVARVSPYSLEGTTDNAYGSAKGKATNEGYLPVCGRYLALQVRPDSGSSSVGAYNANLAVNTQSGQRHFPTAYEVL